MGKLYYGDALTRIRNAGFNPEPIVDARHRISGITVFVEASQLHIMADAVGLYDENSVSQLIANAVTIQKDEDKYRFDPRYGG